MQIVLQTWIDIMSTYIEIYKLNLVNLYLQGVQLTLSRCRK